MPHNRGDWLIGLASHWFMKRDQPEKGGGRSEPRSIQIADKNYTCDICVNDIAEGDYMVKCGCERVFHVECSKTVDACPKCGNAIDTVGYETVGTCPKCQQLIPKGEWIWLCSCEVKYHLSCAKLIDECKNCQKTLDWGDETRMKVIPVAKVVVQLKGNECVHCGDEITDKNNSYECDCGSTYHMDCMETLGVCKKCNNEMPLDKGEQ